jgi:protein-tyrosine phosphatase
VQRIRDWLFVGKYRDTIDKDLLDAYGIDAMLQLAEAVQQPDITSLYLPVEDGQPLPLQLLRQGINFIVEQKERGQLVLVACGAGQSRSVIYAVAALREVEGLHLLEALRAVKEQHSEAMPHPALWESLCEYYHEPMSFHDMLDVAMGTKKLDDEVSTSG